MKDVNVLNPRASISKRKWRNCPQDDVCFDLRGQSDIHVNKIKQATYCIQTKSKWIQTTHYAYKNSVEVRIIITQSNTTASLSLQSPPPVNTTAEFQVSNEQYIHTRWPTASVCEYVCPAAVCAEAYNPDDDEDNDTEPRVVHPKTDEQRRRLQDACRHILLFKTLEQVQHGNDGKNWFSVWLWLFCI